MKHVNINTGEPFEAYGLKCQTLLPEALHGKPPFGSMKAIVRPGQTSVRHMHHETEVFYLISGNGRVNSDDSSCMVAKDSTLLLPAFSSHTITNLSDSEPLEFLTFWWEDYQAIDQQLSGLNLTSGQKILVTATPPTPNGDLHLGHISGPYLGADIFSRFMRLQGNEVFYLTGTDVHQTYVYTKAIQQDKDPVAVANDNTDAIKHTLTTANIAYCSFYEPWKMDQYASRIQQFFQELYNTGACLEKVTEELFDDEQYLHEAFVSGRCPHCKTSSDGNCCEKCGLPHDMTALEVPQSFYSKNTLNTVSVKKLYFPLENYRRELLDYFDSLDLTAHHKWFIHQLFSRTLPEIALSHPGPWGIKHSIAGFEEQIVYVWAEMLPGYLLATQDADGKNWEEFDKRIQFFGFDNTFYHLVLFPAMLMAMGRHEALPNAFAINEFLQLDGSKFSTSREHLIWARDFFSDKPTDIVRMYLSKVRPEQAENNFSVAGFDTFSRDFVEQKLLKTINRFWEYITAISDSRIPEPGAWNARCKYHFRQLNELYQSAIQAHQAETFSTHDIMRAIEQITDIAESQCDMVEFLQTATQNHDQVRTHLALIALSLKAISTGLAGIAPAFSLRLHRELGLGSSLTMTPQLAFISGKPDVHPSGQAYLI